MVTAVNSAITTPYLTLQCLTMQDYLPPISLHPGMLVDFGMIALHVAEPIKVLACHAPLPHHVPP